MSCRPFQGIINENQKKTTSAVAAETSVPSVSSNVRFVNAGDTLVHVRVQNGSLLATELDTPILPGTSLVLTKGEGVTRVSYISPAGPGILHIQPGEWGI